MGNCLVAQSGGPTSVINATVAGIVQANQLNPIYDHVYGGLNGVEGILNGKIVDISKLTDFQIRVLKQTCSSALGSCRYKLKRDNLADFEKLFMILDKLDVDTMFYVGGNDSMDTVAALSQYAKEHNITNHRFVGCPKTVDNDLKIIDHTPGFASAAKFLATVAKTTWLDLNVYTRQEVFILETMGRDAGWLAASTVLSGVVDLLVLPEVPFDEELFFEQVRDVLSKKNKCYIVVSEGAKYADGTYLAAAEAKNDGFAHAVLGGAGQTLKNKLLEAGICERAKVQDMSTLQRCNIASQSKTDVEESFKLGMSAHMRSMDPEFTGKMVALKRREGRAYDPVFFAVDADQVANYVKHVPEEWILPNYRGMSQELYDYVRPLIQGEPELIMDNGIPMQMPPFYMNRK
ncbi:MAG: 6-phosphofructokinase [Erysipelotrichaceae bacterium]|nr:6-phosphofructokinase [Erysipelotrichaceae bacterium]